MLNFIYRFLLISLIIGIIINVFSNYIFKRNNLEDIIAKNQINFVTKIGPTTYYQNKGVPAGFEYELMADFAEYLGVELNIITEESINKGILLLLFYSLGLAIPFILSGYLIQKFMIVSKNLKKNMNLITKIGGGLLLITGILVITNQLQVLGFYLLEYLPFLQKFG